MDTDIVSQKLLDFFLFLLNIVIVGFRATAYCLDSKPPKKPKTCLASEAFPGELHRLTGLYNNDIY